MSIYLLTGRILSVVASVVVAIFLVMWNERPPIRGWRSRAAACSSPGPSSTRCSRRAAGAVATEKGELGSCGDKRVARGSLPIL